jgi:hypothetical protein
VKIANINNFEIVKVIIPKTESYYTCLKLYLLCYNSVNHPEKIISYCLHDYYSNNPEKIKNIYNEIYTKFITALEKLKNDSLVEQNIMKNIGSTFYQFSKLYVSLFPYDSIDIIDKFLKIIMLLKQKKFKKVETLIYLIIINMKTFIHIVRNDKDTRFIFNLKRNDVIEPEINKLINLKNENQKRSSYVIKHKKNIETFIEIILNMLNQAESDKDKKDIKDKNISHPECILFYNLLSNFSVSLDKKSDLYRKLIKFLFNMILVNKSPVSTRVIWIKKLESKKK